ncbi:hypothetical protein AVEN_142657-1 [Araneus ventricosus]|uniref:Uncharacterized protein n=1 Tax=Araneus ventricosus TaxID=182803 RepID=A0A4Y2Q3R3_ARAVE|nr:hypothetical protein AVEN_74346-1 [Araneus ventricosus]GBN58111.1 hypothetical protein AVEN_107588-1 [Araneus ventricosus]GBN58122.1 hypothetical protein AVEN_123881-1 [Araneus ventricosus]GBN58127.1 hypothetical protein AVEN_142657-1 [Araneus ventricosus]
MEHLPAKAHGKNEDRSSNKLLRQGNTLGSEKPPPPTPHLQEALLRQGNRSGSEKPPPPTPHLPEALLLCLSIKRCKFKLLRLMLVNIMTQEHEFKPNRWFSQLSPRPSSHQRTQ